MYIRMSIDEVQMRYKITMWKRSSWSSMIYNLINIAYYIIVTCSPTLNILVDSLWDECFQFIYICNINGNNLEYGYLYKLVIEK